MPFWALERLSQHREAGHRRPSQPFLAAAESSCIEWSLKDKEYTIKQDYNGPTR